jgi:hypothetical protein
MRPRYRVTLTPDERSELEAMTRSGKTTAKRFLYARALLLCDTGPQGPAWTVAHTAEALGVTPRTIEHLKKRFVHEGLGGALTRKQTQKPPREILFGGEFEAHLITLACSDPPQGRDRWTVRLLAEKAVELGLASTVSHMTVKSERGPHRSAYWKIPPKENAAFVAAKREVLAVCALRQDPDAVVVRIDATPPGRLSETSMNRFLQRCGSERL